MPNGYFSYWNYGERKGYSGVGVYTKEKPINVITSLGNTDFDSEGRVVAVEYNDFFLFNIYFPNGKSGEERLKYKLGFYDFFLNYIIKIKSAKTVIVCGDFNTAHNEIDLARPKENSKVSGFLPEEREWMEKFVKAGFIDTFRFFNKEPGNYTWWDLKSKARDRNVGWRIDYVFIDDKSSKNLQNAFILKDVHGSDHCPVGINLSFK